jgi:hypothetical protein
MLATLPTTKKECPLPEIKVSANTLMELLPPLYRPIRLRVRLLPTLRLLRFLRFPVFHLNPVAFHKYATSDGFIEDFGIFGSEFE